MTLSSLENRFALFLTLKPSLYLSKLAFLTISFGLELLSPFANAVEPAESWNPAHSDQWVATDALGRSLPDYHEVGSIRSDKYVACFYFLWHGRLGSDGPYDISKILTLHPEAKDDPDSPYWGKMYAPHHWGESIFGYYVGEDESVLRKHAQMLGDAGVDVICFDVTNQLTFPETYRPLFKVFSEMQKEGNRVPKVAFLCPFWTPNRVVRELWREVYSKDFCQDVWFYWKGKPLILADPDLVSQESCSLNSNGCTPIKIEKGTALTQKFTITRPFKRLFLSSPTWQQSGAAVDFTLRDELGKIVDSRKNVPVQDNIPYCLTFKDSFPAGAYTVELASSNAVSVGWWSREVNGHDYSESANKAQPAKDITWLEATKGGQRLDSVFLMQALEDDDELKEILNFFTFRPSQPDYFSGPAKANQWSWLEAYPQHEYFNDNGELEEMSVGVAQNAVDGKLGVLSNPRSYGRSFHAGSEPSAEGCDYSGKNFQEQWDRVLKIDPEIVFITGWNEWIAGRFDINAPFFGTTPVTFVDQFNEEFSRDCEPMKEGHGDNYYYQMIANIRRFKGVGKPEQSVRRDIIIDGSFDDWKEVAPSFYDTISDPVHRNCDSWDRKQKYVNNTGRNDFIESKVSFDDKNIFFYAKMKDKIQGSPSSKNWIALLLDVDGNPKTGVNGNDFMALATKDGKGLELVDVAINDERGQIDGSAKRTPVDFEINGNEIELSVPLSSLPVEPNSPSILFKWSDGIDVFGDWSAFTTDGDTAPNDRYYYRYIAP